MASLLRDALGRQYPLFTTRPHKDIHILCLLAPLDSLMCAARLMKSN